MVRRESETIASQPLRRECILLIDQVKQTREKEILRKANVNSVGIGYKKVDGETTPQLCIVVGVNKKLPQNQMLMRDFIPQSLDGVVLDVVETGDIKALGILPPVTLSAAQINPTQKHRPIFPGISVGHPNITAGTIGAVAYHDGQPVVLSNNHVLSDQNRAEIGDISTQPGNYDSGSSADTIGYLLDFIPIKFGSDPVDGNCTVTQSIAKTFNFVASLLGRKHRLSVISAQPAYNEVDAAISSITVDFDKQIAEIGEPIDVVEATLGMDVQKFGRTTSYTIGTVEQINATVSVGYDDGFAVFTNQIMLSAMSAGGDSGSAIISMDKKLVGLLFAGSDQITIASPMSRVFSLLGLSLA